MKRQLRAFTAILLALLFCLAFPAFAASLPEDGADLSDTVIILHTNDTHGHIDDNMGFSSVGALRQEYAQSGATTLLLDAGDVFHGMPAATLTEGRDIVPLLNALSYDAITPGNHDFNYGYEHLLELAGMLDFPVISANIRLDGELMFQENTIIERDGITFGIFGLTTPDTAFQTNPQHIEGVTFDDPAKAAAEQVALLEQAGVDYIIALTHIGVDHASKYTTDKLAAEVNGIDIIIDGHSHTQMQDGKPMDASAAFEEQEDTLIASTGAYIENIGVVTIKADSETAAKIYNAEAYAGKEPQIEALIADINTAQAPELAEVIGKTPVGLDGERENVRTKETNLGDVSADSLLDATGADIALMNGGNIRATINAGDITREDIITVFPFGNFILTKEVTGQAMLDALELGVSGYPDELGGFPQVAGVTFRFDAGQPAGSRVFDVQVNGSPIDLQESYVLATNDFLAAGGDDYTMLAGSPEISYYSSLEEVFTEYIQKTKDFPAEAEGRIVMADKAEDSITGESDPVPNTYTVEKGDSLWKIAQSIYGDGARWPEIYEMNRADIHDPDLIEIGQQLQLPEAG